MRDLDKAGSNARLRLTAAANGWRRERVFPGEDGGPLVSWRHQDGAVYITGDPEVLPWPLAERVRVLAGAFFAQRCPACGAEARFAEGEPNEELNFDCVQLIRLSAVAHGVGVSSNLWLVIDHAADCPGRPGALLFGQQAASN